MNKQRIVLRNTLIFLAVFSIAMGFLEAAVVVYLRQLYYPEGFAFPLKLIAIKNLSIEYLREISTIVMLLSMGIIAGKNFYERFSFFLYCFGIWDIFYYVWLKVLLNWPPSLLTWDILFLIPVTWTGPVLAPIICALTMIVLSGLILYLQQKNYQIRINSFEGALLSIGAIIIFSTFILDYSKIMIQCGFTSRFWSLGADPYFQEIITRYIPTAYNWHFFLIGESLILCFLVILLRRVRSTA